MSYAGPNSSSLQPSRPVRLGRAEKQKRSPHHLLLLLFATTFVGIAASIVASYVLRRIAVPSEIQYVPRECAVVVATGDIKSVWEAVKRHFGFLVASDDPTPKEGSISRGLLELRQFFENAGMPLRSPEDLEKH